MISLNIAFAGTPAFGLPCLEVLLASTHHLKAIYTQPDRPAGRGRNIQASAVKTWGEAHDLPIHQPLNFKDEHTQHTLAALELDVLIVIAYGLLLPQAVLTLPRLGCINVHASLLPRWRGASPIQQALLHGDSETGITLMQMDRGMDTGAILAQRSTPIASNDTAQSLHDTLGRLAPELLLNTLDAIATQRATPVPQDNTKATYAPKINKNDARINWQQTAIILDQHIRAFHPWPIATFQHNDTAIRVHHARIIQGMNPAPPGTILSIESAGIAVATGDGTLLLETIQYPGARAMPVADWLHAGRRQLDVGVVLL